MEQSKLTTVLVFLIPQILSLIIEKYKVDDEKATGMFYSSELFKGLEDEQTKLWHLSAMPCLRYLERNSKLEK